MEKSYIYKKFNVNMSNLGIFYKNSTICVGVSGGADSMLLALLAKQWCKAHNIRLIALIVNHNLRIESKEESINVSKALDLLKVENIILERKQVSLTSKIQETARFDRYNLLLDKCFELKASYLLIAHHLDDQIETMVLRENSGINLVGDSGMSAKLVLEKAILLRPLLNFTKNEIIEFLIDNKISWIEDPSNKNEKYERVKVRNYLNKVEVKEKQLLIQRLHYNYKKRKELEANLLSCYIKMVKINQFGLIKINIALFNIQDENIKILLLRNLICYSNGESYKVNIKKVKVLLSNLYKIKKYSLGKTIISVNKDNITIFKEPSHSHNIIKNNRWDDRFLVENNNYEIKTLSQDDKNILLQNKEFKKYFKNYEINMENIQSLPWCYKSLNQKGWVNNKYVELILYLKNSLFMNEFINI